MALELTSVCIVDETGKIVFEGKVDSDPEALRAFFAKQDLPQERIVLEAGPLSQWLYGGMAEAGYPVICAETRHMKAALAAQTITPPPANSVLIKWLNLISSLKNTLWNKGHT